MRNLNDLIGKAREAGATVLVTYDHGAWINEGREIVETVAVVGLRGCGPFPMPAISAAERLGELLA